MTLRCAVLDDYQHVALTAADWTPLVGRVQTTAFSEHFENEDTLVDAVADADIIVIMRERTPFPTALFARLPRLKLLVTTGMRNAAVDLGAARAHSVTVCGTASSSAPPAELTWALILGLARHVVRENNALRSDGPWQSTVGTDLCGKRLGLIGLGKIGTQVARVGLAFGMEVVAWSQNLTKERAEAVGARLVTKETLLETSDFVSLHLVLSERTKEILGRADLERLKPSAYLVNTSRAGLIDQDALLGVLEQQKIAGAGLDVSDLEPLPSGHPFRCLPNVLATPHLGYVTQANYATYYREVVEDIQAFLTGTPVRVLT